jgi:hydrogenase expression/formation protein HypD
MTIRFLDEFRDPRQAQALVERIVAAVNRSTTLMEVCGTHTHAIARHGIRGLMPPDLRLLSGPGCPVCVTPPGEIDAALELARRPEVTVCTFGDMVRVPGSEASLADLRAHGADVRVVYSPLEAVEIAGREPDRSVVFIAVGFETTAPTVAVAVREAQMRGLRNFSLLCAHKLVPPALEALMHSDDVRVDGFLCPGHVSVIIGAAAYQPLAKRYHVPCVIAGFEPLDILQGILALAEQVRTGRAEVEIGYARAVTREGNTAARAAIQTVFEVTDARWRGLGVIPASGLALRSEYAAFDALQRHEVHVPEGREHPGCHCGEVLRGAMRPAECAAFASACEPARPLGPCMVSSEGACAAEYRYRATT